MSMFALLLSFAPWLLFKILVTLPLGEPMFMLKLALSLAAAVSLYQSRKSTVRGFIYWGTMGFFAFAFVAVVLLSNLWVIGHLGLLSQLTMNVMAWGSMLCRRPFTIDYAKQHVPPQFWGHPRFLRKNYLITAIWGVYFLLGFLLAEVRIYEPQVSHALLEVLENLGMMGAMLLTSHFSKVPSGTQAIPEAPHDTPAPRPQ